MRTEVSLHFHDAGDAFDSFHSMNQNFSQKFTGHQSGVAIVKCPGQLSHAGSLTGFDWKVNSILTSGKFFSSQDTLDKRFCAAQSSGDD